MLRQIEYMLRKGGGARMTSREEMINDDGWFQEEVIHCRDTKCGGMLLTHDAYHPYMCSDCKKFWVQKIEWVEIQ